MSLPGHSQVHDGHGQRALTRRPQRAHVLTPPNSVNDHRPILWNTQTDIYIFASPWNPPKKVIQPSSTALRICYVNELYYDWLIFFGFEIRHNARVKLLNTEQVWVVDSVFDRGESHPWSRDRHVQLCADRHTHNFICVSVQHLQWLMGQTHRSTSLQKQSKFKLQHGIRNKNLLFIWVENKNVILYII